MARRGAYVTFEGPEAVGKTHQIYVLAGQTGAYITRESGGYITNIREILHDKSIGELTPEAEMLLFSADRNLTKNFIVIPNITAGRSVISDRSYISTYAYQCYAGGVDLAFAQQATQLALGDFRADKVVFLDAPLEVTEARLIASGRMDPNDRFESRSRDYHTRVRNGFLELAREMGARAALIEATGTREEVAEQVFRACGQLLLDGVSDDA